MESLNCSESIDKLYQGTGKVYCNNVFHTLSFKTDKLVGLPVGQFVVPIFPSLRCCVIYSGNSLGGLVCQLYFKVKVMQRLLFKASLNWYAKV